MGQKALSISVYLNSVSEVFFEYLLCEAGCKHRPVVSRGTSEEGELHLLLKEESGDFLSPARLLLVLASARL